MHFLKALFKTNLEINVSKLWLREYFKIFGTKVLYFTMRYELTKNECFLLSFIGGD